MHLLTHCCRHRSADEDLEAARRQTDAARVAGKLRRGRSDRIGNIAYLEDDGTLRSSHGGWLLAPASRRFFEEITREPFDFVSFFPQTAPNDGAFHVLVHNADRGIGKPLVDYREFYGAKNGLQSVHLFYPLTMLPLNPTDRLWENNDTTLSLIAQEVGHRWAASVQFEDREGRLSGDLLGRDESHWSFFLDSGASAMEGNRWEGVGDYHWSLTPTDGYCPLDLYLMGVLPAGEVPSLRLLRNAQNPDGDPWLASDRPTTGIRLMAEVEEIPLDAIVRVKGQGPREPAPQPGQEFRHAFVLLLRRQEPLIGSRLLQLERIRTCWEAYFSRATGERARVNTTL
jgi:hypothetical protein